MTRLVAYLSLLFIVSACSSVHHVEKRRYKKGYFIQWNKKEVKNVKQNHESIFSNDVELLNQQKTKDKTANQVAVDVKKTPSISETKEDYFFTENKSSNDNTTSIFPAPTVSKTTYHSKSRNSTSKISTIKKSTDTGLYLISGIIGAIIMSLFFANKKRAKKVSKWASENPKKTVTAILGTKSVLALGALHFGSMLHSSGYNFSENSLFVLLSLFSVSAVFYPIRKKQKGIFKQGYLKQKTHDIVLATLGFSMMLSLGNVSSQDPNYLPILNPITNQTSIEEEYIPVMSDETAESKNSSDEDTFGKVVGTIFIVAAFLGLLLLLAMLSCSISCNGQEALAIVVFIGGLIALIALLVHVLKLVWSKQQYRNEYK